MQCFCELRMELLAKNAWVRIFLLILFITSTKVMFFVWFVCLSVNSLRPRSTENHTILHQSFCLGHGKKWLTFGEGHLKVTEPKITEMKTESHSSTKNHTKLRQSFCLGHGKKWLTFGKGTLRSRSSHGSKVKDRKNEIHSSAENQTKLCQSVC